jgi:DNA anti-recombination protein RmuC
MSVQVATLDILTEQGRFEPEVARAIGNAIDMEIASATHPLATREDVKDARVETRQMLIELRAEMRQLNVELRADMYQLNVELRAEMRQLNVELRAEMSQLNAELRAEMKTHRAELSTQIEQMRASLTKDFSAAMFQLIRWVFGSLMVLLGAIAGLYYFLLPHLN